jgi:hypothetical protein
MKSSPVLVGEHLGFGTVARYSQCVNACCTTVICRR